MIFRVFIKFTTKSCKNQDFKEHKLLTISVLIIVKDQLIIMPRIELLLDFDKKLSKSIVNNKPIRTAAAIKTTIILIFFMIYVLLVD